MKRVIAVATVVAAVAMPATAGAGPAADQSFSGSSKRGVLSVDFTVYKLGNKPVGVDNFKVQNLEMECNEDPAAELDFKLKIKGDEFFKVNDKKRFRAVSNKGPRTLKVTGEFVTNNKVEGKVKAEGRFDGGALTGCFGTAPYEGQTQA